MKKSKLLLLLGVALTFTACDAKTNNSTSDSNSNNSNSDSISDNSGDVSDSSSEVIVSDSSSLSELVEDEYNILPNWEEIQVDISVGEDLLDLSVNRAFGVGLEYNASYTMASSDLSKERVISSNEKVFSIEKSEGQSFKIRPHHAGQAFLRIYDSEGDVRYCKKVVVKDPIPTSDLEEYLVYDCEYWVSVMSWTDSFTITFNEGGQYTISGAFSNVPFSNTGTYEFVGIVNNGKEYDFKFTDKDIASYGLTGFQLATVGSFMYLMGTYGTEAILFPNDEIENNK